MYYDFIKSYVLENFRKEYVCHLVYVEQVALNLQKKLGGDIEIIQISSIGHDIGRIESGDNLLHAERGSKMIYDMLLMKGYEKERAQKISRCTLMHNKTSGFESIEEEIVSNADALSKLIFHDMFMLMCKKEDYISKAKWGLKYIEKGYNNLTFDVLKEEYRNLYNELKTRYELVIV